MTRRLGARTAVAALLVAGIVGGPVAAAHADDELDRYLAEAATADYSGSAVVVSTWGGYRAAAVVEVHKDGPTVVVGSGGGAATVVAEGSVSDASGTVRMSAWSARAPSHRYRVVQTRPVVVIGRDAVELVIDEDGARRAVVTIDEATGAALATTVFDGDGSPFRESAFTRFEEGFGAVDVAGAGPGYTTMTATASDLPAELAGYRLTDGYRDPSGVAQAYFSDGLFSFSVFALEGSTRLAGDADAVELVVDDHSYRVVVEPTRLRVSWSGAEGDFLLVGDLPPDHLDDVLRRLPTPGTEGLLDRVWHALFG